MELFRTLKAISGWDGRMGRMYPRPLLRLEHLAVLIKTKATNKEMQQKNKISKQTITRKTKATSTLMQETKKQLTLVAGSGQTSH